MVKSLVEDYPRGLKMAALTPDEGDVCNNIYYFRLTPPEDLLEYKELATHIIFEFASGTSASDRIIKSVGIADEVPAYGVTPNYSKRIEKNWAADANRRIEINLDLSHLIQADADNWVEVIFPSAFQGVSDFGDWLLWKIDILYTTTGVNAQP